MNACKYCKKHGKSLLENNSTFEKFCLSCYDLNEVFHDLSSFSKIVIILKEETNVNEDELDELVENFYIFILRTNLWKKLDFQNENEKIILKEISEGIPKVSLQIEKYGNMLYENQIKNNFLINEDKTDQSLFTLCYIFKDYCYQQLGHFGYLS